MKKLRKAESRPSAKALEWTASDHELGFVSAFVESARRDRVVQLMQPKRRSDLRSALPHFKWFDERRVLVLAPDELLTPRLEAILRQRGAVEQCYMISADAELDAKFMALTSALNAVVGSNEPTIVSFVPGKLAYYEGEGFNERYLFVKE